MIRQSCVSCAPFACENIHNQLIVILHLIKCTKEVMRSYWLRGMTRRENIWLEVLMYRPGAVRSMCHDGEPKILLSGWPYSVNKCCTVSFFLLAASTRVRTAFYGPAYAITNGPYKIFDKVRTGPDAPWRWKPFVYTELQKLPTL